MDVAGGFGNERQDGIAALRFGVAFHVTLLCIFLLSDEITELITRTRTKMKFPDWARNVVSMIIMFAGYLLCVHITFEICSRALLQLLDAEARSYQRILDNVGQVATVLTADERVEWIRFVVYPIAVTVGIFVMIQIWQCIDHSPGAIRPYHIGWLLSASRNGHIGFTNPNARESLAAQLAEMQPNHGENVMDDVCAKYGVVRTHVE